MNVTFKNAFISRYPGIDYDTSLPAGGRPLFPDREIQRIEQGFFKFNKAANLGRLVSLCDTVSQVAKLIIDSLVLIVAIPIFFAVSALSFSLSIPLHIFGVAKLAAGLIGLAWLSLFMGVGCALAIPLQAMIRTSVLASDILGIAAPRIGQFARLRAEPASLYNIIETAIAHQQRQLLLFGAAAGGIIPPPVVLAPPA